MKLWPKALVRPIRFPDLRHTTASLLLTAGASTAVMQRILRHSDPRITTEVYGHLVPDYLRSEIDRPGPDRVLRRKKRANSPSNDSDDLSGWARRDSNPLPPASEAGTLSK